MTINRPIALRCRNNIGAGRELQALLPKGFRCNNTGYGVEQEQWITIWYERGVQFPTGEWEALQDEIMQVVQDMIQAQGKGKR